MPLHIPTETVRVHRDARGALIKAWPAPASGEVYVVELRPGSSRGHHLHRHGGEWFIPLSGRALLIVEDPATGERAEVVLDGLRARVEAGLAHALLALDGEVALVMAVADREHGQDETLPHPLRLPR